MNKTKNRLLIAHITLSLGGILLVLALLYKNSLMRKCHELCSAEENDIHFSQRTYQGLSENLLEDEILRFAVIADPHLGAVYSNGRIFQEALDRAKEKEAQIVVVIGDLVESGKQNELERVKEILDESGVTYFTVPGNHDSDYKSKSGDSFENYKKTFGNPFKVEEISLDNTNTKWEKAKLIFINSAAMVTPERRIDDEQMLWLEKELYDTPKADNELRFIFMETPLNWLGRDEQNRLRHYFCTAKINGLFTGNIHATEQFYSKCTYPAPLKEDRSHQVFPTFSVGTTYLPSRSEFPGFVIMHYFEGGQFELEKVVLPRGGEI